MSTNMGTNIDVIWPFGYDEKLVQHLIAEAHRIGKVPWTASGMSEAEARMRLGYRYPQETYEETQARWARETGWRVTEYPPYK